MMTLRIPKMRFGLILAIMVLGLATIAHGQSDLTQQGIAFMQAKRFKEAIHLFNGIIQKDPNNINAVYYRGMARYYTKNIDSAISDYTKAIRKAPEKTDIYTSRAVAYFRKGDYEQAKKDLETVLKKNAGDLNAINQMAWMMAVCPEPQYRDGKKAVDLAQKVVKIKTTPNYLDTLAAAYAENKQFQKAAETQRKVIAMLTQENRFGKLDVYLQRLKTYESDKSWRADTAATKATVTKDKTDKSKPVTDQKTSKSTLEGVATGQDKPVKSESAPLVKPAKTGAIEKPNTKGERLTLQSVSSGPGKYPYTIFISTYQDPQTSKNKVLKLRNNQDPAYMSHAYFKDSGHWYQIYYGWYGNVEKAKSAAEKLIKRHFRKAIVVKKPFAVQAAVASSKADLKKFETRLTALNYPSYQIVDEANPKMVRLLIGAYSTKTVPDKLLATLKSAGFKPKVVRR